MSKPQDPSLSQHSRNKQWPISGVSEVETFRFSVSTHSFILDDPPS